MNKIDNYISWFSSDKKEILQKIRLLISWLSDELVETFGYWIPTFDLNWKHLIHYAAFKNHIGLYPTPAWVEAFKEKLNWYKIAKWSIQFPLDRNIPYDLIKEITLYRINEVKK